MAKIFFPKQSISIPASAPHENAEYLVSIGTEIWNGDPHEVIKVQMAYDGKISGRRSPSYPIDTDDEERVHNAIKKLKKK